MIGKFQLLSAHFFFKGELAVLPKRKGKEMMHLAVRELKVSAHPASRQHINCPAEAERSAARKQEVGCVCTSNTRRVIKEIKASVTSFICQDTCP